MKKLTPLLRRLLTLLLCCLCPFLALRADDVIPPNLGRGLSKLVEWQKAQPPAHSDAERSAALVAHLGRNAQRVQTDEAGRVTVDIRLDGTVAPATVKASLTALGLQITGEHVARRADGRDGIISARLPLDQAAAAARTPGVFSVLVAHGPRPRVGEVTSQGVNVLHANAVQAAGYLGKGITVGVLSDSYDVATEQSVGYAVTTNAAEDVETGDLPGAGNPDGYTTPVYVLEDGSRNPNQDNTDEGRAILQIIHDVRLPPNWHFARPARRKASLPPISNGCGPTPMFLPISWWTISASTMSRSFPMASSLRRSMRSSPAPRWPAGACSIIRRPATTAT
jgi:hypothetical protein